MDLIDQEWVVISKDNCIYCDMVFELFDDSFIEYKILKTNKHLSPEQLAEIKPPDAKSYPFIFHNKKYFGGYRELKKELNK